MVLPSTLNWFRKSTRKTFINFIFGLIGNNKVHDHEVFEMFVHQQRKSPKQLMLKEAESHVHTFVPFHQSHKNPVSASANPESFATISILAEEFPDILQYEISK